MATAAERLIRYRAAQNRLSATLARGTALALLGRPLGESSGLDLARLLLPGVLAAREESWSLSLDFVRAFAPVRVPTIPIPTYSGGILARALDQVLRSPGGRGPAPLAARVVRHAQQSGRETVLEATRRGNARYARVGSGDDCAFCLILISRGPVYSERGSGFRAHDHCQCTAVPVYDDRDWPGREQYEQANELYASAGREGGKLNAVRRAVYDRRQRSTTNQEGEG